MSLRSRTMLVTMAAMGALATGDLLPKVEPLNRPSGRPGNRGNRMGIGREPFVRRRGEFKQQIERDLDRSIAAGGTRNKKKLRHLARRKLPGYGGTDRLTT